MLVNKNIFVSIASYLDMELQQTVEDLLAKALRPNLIHLSVNSQDRQSKHPDLESVCSKYGATITYVKIDFKDSNGACHARTICQKPLNDSFKYYMQIDSHTLFSKNWDISLIEDYERCKIKWGNYIFSTYPLSYYYNNEGEPLFETGIKPNCLKPIKTLHCSRYTSKYCDYMGDEFGSRTDYFAGGFAFGDTQHFLKIPYDERIYYYGEEPTMSIRFYCEDIAIVCPPKNYIYHHYSGQICKKRTTHWGVVKDWNKNDQDNKILKLNLLAEDTLNSFYSNKLEYPFGVKNVLKMKEWIAKVSDEY